MSACVKEQILNRAPGIRCFAWETYLPEQDPEIREKWDRLTLYVLSGTGEAGTDEKYDLCPPKMSRKVGNYV
jgi:hypothetical protein